MIRREDGDSWLLIAQADHAALAAELATAWGSEQTPSLPDSDLLISAIRNHDDGWRDWEQRPTIVAETGRPRDFLEMPSDEATAIWNRSIEKSYQRERHTDDVLTRFQNFLSSRSKRLTPDRTLVARVALSMRESFDADRVVDRVGGEDPERLYSRSTIYRTLGWLEESGLLVRDNRIRDRHVYRTSGAPTGPSPWSGLWVSRHFTALAEKSRENRPGEDPDARVLDAFLEHQRRLQALWRAEVMSEFEKASALQLENEGFRWLRFFDLLSLWLCVAPAVETKAIERPDSGPIHFTPLKSGEIAVEPYPFRSDETFVEIPARRIAAAPMSTNEEFHERWNAAPIELLQWSLVRW